MVSRSTVWACGLVGVVSSGAPPTMVTITGEAARLVESRVALSPDLMLVVSITSVLPSQWARLEPIQLSTFLGHRVGSSIGMMRVASISPSITIQPGDWKTRMPLL